MTVQLVSKISNLCDPDPPTSQTDRQTDGRHAISIPRYALVHRAVIIGPRLTINCSYCHGVLSVWTDLYWTNHRMVAAQLIGRLQLIVSWCLLLVDGWKSFSAIAEAILVLLSLRLCHVIGLLVVWEHFVKHSVFVSCDSRYCRLFLCHNPQHIMIDALCLPWLVLQARSESWIHVNAVIRLTTAVNHLQTWRRRGGRTSTRVHRICHHELTSLSTYHAVVVHVL